MLVESLRQQGIRAEPDPYKIAGAYRLEFDFSEGTTTIEINLQDSSGADLVISRMGTDNKGRGYGTEAVEKILAWAKENGLHNIRSVQVQKGSESFWLRNGFEKIAEPNPTNDFVYRAEVETTD